MTTTVVTTAHQDERSTTAAVGRGLAIGAGVALVANTAIFLLGAMGAPIRVVTGWEPDGVDLRLVDVIGASLIWLVIAAAALWVLERYRGDGFRVWAALAIGFGVLSIVPVLGLDIEADSTLALSLMHLVVVAAAVGGQWRARVSERARGAARRPSAG